MSGTDNTHYLGRATALQITPAVENFVARQFFTEHPELAVQRGFSDRILLAGMTQYTSNGSDLLVYSLKDTCTDRDVRNELPGNHLIELWQITSVINQALQDRTVALLRDDGYANLFYVHGINGDVFVVDIGRPPSCRLWQVDAHRLDEHPRWRTGDHIFVPKDPT